VTGERRDASSTTRTVRGHLASFDVGSCSASLWSGAVGTLTFDAAAPATLATPFDLASLTKSSPRRPS
jgi:hypothetical protein